MFLKKIISTLLIIFVTLSGFAKQLPDLGSPLNQRLTLHQEQILGQQFIHLIKAQLPIVYDPIINDYVRGLGKRLVKHSNQPSRTYHFFVVDNAEINAFSGPDGYIGVNNGLILKAQSEGELAVVLSHEIAHVSQLHIARLIAEQKTLKLSTIVTMLVALAIGTQYPTAAFGVMTASNAGQHQHMLNFSREQENEADRMGMQILKKSGFDLCNVSTFFSRVNRDDQLNKTEITEMFRTHPTVETRLAEAYHRGQSCKLDAKRDLEFKLIQARLKMMLTPNINELIKHDVEELNAHNFSSHCCENNDQCCIEKTSLQYAYVLALLKAGHVSQAKGQIEHLLKRFPDQVLFQIEQAHIEERLHHDQKAFDLWLKLYQHHANHYGVLIEYAQFLSHQQKFQQVVSVLKPHYEVYRNDEVYLILLSEAQGRGNNLVEAYQIRARICLLNGDKRAAKEQMEMAFQFAEDVRTKNRIRMELSKL